MSITVTSSTGAPQGTLLSPLVFALYIADFQHNSQLCHMQKFSDDTAIVACAGGEGGLEYRKLVKDLVRWCHKNQLQLNAGKTKEMVLDFRRLALPPQPVFIEGAEVEIMGSHKYLEVELDNRLEWSLNTDTIYRQGQSRLYFLRRLALFKVCTKLLLMFY